MALGIVLGERKRDSIFAQLAALAFYLPLYGRILNWW